MFGAGNLDSSKPYGLTKTEEVIVKNKKTVIKNEKRLNKTSTQVQNLKERVQGMESLLEGESIKLNKVFNSLNKQIETYKLYVQTANSDINKNSEIIANMQTSIDNDMKALKSHIEQNDKNIKILNTSFDKIASLVNNINANYVTKKDFDKLISLLDKNEVSTKTVKKTPPKTSSKSSKEILEEAKAFFKRDYFTNAIPLFQELIRKNYRPAESNYYMGEIKYYRKKYEEALQYFKKSMTLYDKADYLPKLLLHSAISFDRLGDSQNAQNFYTTLVDIYPESNEAKEASKKIK
jgi:TolA-binding protein